MSKTSFLKLFEELRAYIERQPTNMGSPVEVQYSKRCSKKIREIVQKSRSHQHSNIIISTSTSTMSPKTSMYEVPSDVSCKLQADFVYDNGIVEISLLHA